MKQLLTLLAIALLVTIPLKAQNNTEFKIRYETFIKGDIKIIGNYV